MNNYKNGLNETDKRNKYIKGGLIFIVVSVVFFFVIAKMNDVSQYEYLKEVFVSEAQILEMKTNADSSPQQFFVRLKLIDQSVTLKEDQSWFEVNYTFYQKCVVNNKIGVLVGNFDVFKGSAFAVFGNTTQTYENSNYSVVDVFDSLDQANEKYPHKTFTAEAQITKKTSSTNEGNYFVLSYDAREMSIQVDNDLYNRYIESEMVTCDFDGIGDFVKIVGMR